MTFVALVVFSIRLAENLVHACGRLLILAWKQMAILRECETGLGVAKALRYFFGIHAVAQRVAGVGVPAMPHAAQETL
jgi:hypothetical protein